VFQSQVDKSCEKLAVGRPFENDAHGVTSVPHWQSNISLSVQLLDLFSGRNQTGSILAELQGSMCDLMQFPIPAEPGGDSFQF
jgi:hypothetical protein